VSECVWVVPRVPINYANTQGHWATRRREAIEDKSATAVGWILIGSPRVRLPARVRLTLCYERALRMDFDNLVHRLKYVRDEVARCLIPKPAPGEAPIRADDRDGLHFVWSYAARADVPEPYQTLTRPPTKQGVLVEVEELTII
jgi:hypothetical protein